MSGRTFALCTIVVALTRDPLVVMLNATRFPFVSFLRPHLDTYPVPVTTYCVSHINYDAEFG